MEGSRCISRSRGGVLHCVAATFYHTRGGKEGKVAAKTGRETIGDKVLAAAVGQRVVASCTVGNRAGGEVVALGCSRDATGASAPSATAALATTGADGNAFSSDLNIGIIVAIETFLSSTLCGEGKDGTVADGDGTCAAIVAVNRIVAI